MAVFVRMALQLCHYRPLRKEVCVFLFLAVMWHVGKFLLAKLHVHHGIHLFARLNNHPNLIRYFFNLDSPLTAVLIFVRRRTESKTMHDSCHMSGISCEGWYQISSGSASMWTLSMISLAGPVKLTFALTFSSEPVAPSYIREQRCTQLCHKALSFRLNWMEWERSLQFTKKAWGWIPL